MENQDQHQELAIQNSATLLAQSENELSVYSGKLTSTVLRESFFKIKEAFPSLPIGFYDILRERLFNNNFSDQRLKDAVNHVIDNCIYPTPTIAEFIIYDRKVKLYTYDEACKKVSEYGKPIGKIFELKIVNGKKYWILKN